MVTAPVETVPHTAQYPSFHFSMAGIWSCPAAAIYTELTLTPCTQYLHNILQLINLQHYYQCPFTTLKFYTLLMHYNACMCKCNHVCILILLQPICLQLYIVVFSAQTCITVLCRLWFTNPKWTKT